MIRFILISLVLFITANASYLNVAQKDLDYKVAIAERMKKSRVRLSNTTKLVKILYMDTKRLTHTTFKQRNTSDSHKPQKSL